MTPPPPTAQPALPSALEATFALDDEQRAAIAHEDGPLLIVAGAGTGKTTVIARRIAHLIETRRARPSEILALTFNDKAAVEMQERVDLLVPYGFADVTVATFHSFGEDVLSGHGLEIGIAPGFTILDKTAQALFLAERLEQLHLVRYAPLSDPTRYLAELAGYFDRAKDEPYRPDEIRRAADRYRDADDPALRDRAERELELADAYETYNRMLWKAGFVDFGDLLALTLRLFEESPATLRHFQDRYRYLLVDEFQDTNPVQFKIVRRLAERHRNLVVVGDDDQSIYRFRGAKVTNLMAFLAAYPGAKEVLLVRNYRSRQNLLDCAHQLIRNNDPDRLEARRGYDKRLIAAAEGLGTLERLEFATATEEADAVARRIAEEVAAGRRRPGDFAILARAHDHLIPFLGALKAHGLPFHLTGNKGL
ncbi:MAG TPA: ATP-dependent helicase, partial [Candidatus Eisenbacteria bacterium]|nr:ATP-dependent helicase [Candidatus Eisenbacteria bacterium]